jgi:hypothetical protein
MKKCVNKPLYVKALFEFAWSHCLSGQAARDKPVLTKSELEHEALRQQALVSESAPQPLHTNTSCLTRLLATNPPK